MQKRPKILFVTAQWPSAPAYGGQQRVLSIANLLGRLGEVSFVIVSNAPDEEETVRRTRREFNVRRIIRPLPTVPGNSIERLMRRLRHEFDATYFESGPCAVGPPDCARILELAADHDVVWIHAVMLASRFPIGKWPHSVLDADNLPSSIYRSAAQASGSPVRRLLDLRMAWIWRRREQVLTQRFDVVTVCSENDRRYLGNQDRTHVIPNGFQPSPADRCLSPQAQRIGFIGTFDWMPNEQGARWFIRDVWPLIKRESPRAQLRLVGRGSEGCLTKLGPDIAGLGWIADPTDEIATWSAMVVPIKVGAGTRIKIAEGFARKCPVVATTLGAFGYEARNGDEILLADGASDFASACVLLLSNPALGEALAERAHKRFVKEWTWDSYASRVGRVIEDCLARNGKTAA